MRAKIDRYAPYALALILFSAALTKVLGLEFQVVQYKQWNFPLWLMYAIGWIEIAVVGLLLFKPTRYTGLAALIFIMVGAILALVVGFDFTKTVLPAAILGLSGYLFYTHRPDGDSAFTPVMVLAGLILVLGLFLWGHGPTPANTDGEIETLPGGARVTHHFKEAGGIRWHYVSAGRTDRETVLLINGFPESWWAFHHQINALSADYHVIAVDMKPYGQTAKDYDGDHSYATIAREMTALLDALGVRRLHLIGHDRGTVVADHLAARLGEERILRYVRMQQSANEAHGNPKPPHALMGSLLGTLAIRARPLAWAVYGRSPYVAEPLDPATRARLLRELQYRGTPQAVPISFKTTAWDNELADRVNRLFKKMSMPTLVLQGELDPGQRPEEYANTTDWLARGRVQFIEAGHFLHLERPELVNAAILSFLKESP